MDQETLRKLQLTELSILVDVAKFCDEHHIRYSLYGGTLLGAVRHQGFIPWDDDLDICMPREDYDRFIALWQQNAPEGYIIQNKEIAPAFGLAFTKMRKDHTALLSGPSNGLGLHQGIFIDIFPFDRIPNGLLRRAVFIFQCVRYLLYTKESLPVKGSILVKLACRVFLFLVPKGRRPAARARLLRKITRSNDDPTANRICIAFVTSMRKILPPDLFDKFVKLPFEGEMFACVADYDEYLTKMYGDYMQLPPEEERVCPHSPKLIQFGPEE